MLTYWTQETIKTRSKFIYVTVSREHAERIFPATTFLHTMRADQEAHITCESAYDRYLEKRKCTPAIVKICKTQKEVDALMEVVGYAL